jgi:hypothetical protein
MTGYSQATLVASRLPQSVACVRMDNSVSRCVNTWCNICMCRSAPFLSAYVILFEVRGSKGTNTA